MHGMMVSRYGILYMTTFEKCHLSRVHNVDICKERPTGRWRRKHDVSEMLLQNEMNRQNSIAARQLALQQGWTRCPHCREVIARSASTILLY